MEEKCKRAAAIIQRAVKNGLTEVQVLRFPNELCTDRGRAINQGEPGWENTLTGIPKDMFQFWHEHLRPRGYKVHAQIVDFPGGMPGDIGIFLSWQPDRTDRFADRSRLAQRNGGKRERRITSMLYRTPDSLALGMTMTC